MIGQITGTKMSFKNIGLCPEIVAGATSQGYTKPTPIQAKAIPIILNGKDILAGAQTGTGKTAAFTLPVLQKLTQSGRLGGRRPRVLILTPTRELAVQVGQSVETYGSGLKKTKSGQTSRQKSNKPQQVTSTTIFGGVNIKPQIATLSRGVDVVIGTPGRLLDLMGRHVLDLSSIEILILDEADRMLDMGFIHDIRRIIKMVPKSRQTLMFSATYSDEIRSLAGSILRNPVHVEVARQNETAQTIDQCLYHVPRNQKREVLSHLIRNENWNQVLVFTRTKHGANRLAKQLQSDGIQATAIHGNKSQAARTRALSDFKEQKVRALVATDIAARGLDIEKLPFVVNFDLSHVAEDYVHRIGRTGRAGTTGKAVSLVSQEEIKLLRSIERLIQKPIAVNCIDGLKLQSKSVSQKPKTPTLQNRRKPTRSSQPRGPRTERLGGPFSDI